jgi:hypothetical protein
MAIFRASWLKADQHPRSCLEWRALPANTLRFLVDLGVSSLFIQVCSLFSRFSARPSHTLCLVLFQKLYSAGIVLSPLSLRYWTSLPALVLVDAFMAVLMQLAANILASELLAFSYLNSRSGWAPIVQDADDDSEQGPYAKEATAALEASSSLSVHIEQAPEPDDEKNTPRRRFLSFRFFSVVVMALFLASLAIMLFSIALLTVALYEAHGYIFNWEQVQHSHLFSHSASC